MQLPHKVVQMRDEFQTSWQMGKDIQDNILYQKWSVKTMGEIITAKADLASDIADITANKDSVYILAYLMWLCRSAKEISELQ